MPTLQLLVHDPAPEVRRIAAERLPPALLGPLAHDADWMVRWEVAGRAGGASLQLLLTDPELEVRERALQHLAEPAHG
jgi:hypothetical protein